MTGALEATLQAARATPFPGAWVLAQILAAVAALGYVWVRARRWPLFVCFAFALPAGVLGAFALGLAFRLLDRLAGRDVDLLGVAAYGALAGVVMGFVALSRRLDVDVLEGLDLIAPALALLVAIGRLGCFLSGCDAGHISDGILSVRFPAGSAVFREHVTQALILASDAWSLAVHPAQLYEAVLAMALAALAHELGRRRFAPGLVFGMTGLGYTLVRGFADILRFPAPAAIYGLIASLLAGISVVLLLFHCARALEQRKTWTTPPEPSRILSSSAR